MNTQLNQVFDPSVFTLPVIISSAFLALAISIVFYYSSLYSYWSSKKVLGPKPIPIVGNALAYFSKPIHELHKEWTDKFGPSVGFYEGMTRSLLVSEAHVVHDVTIKSFSKFTDLRAVYGHHLVKKQLINRKGQEWRIHRSVMTPTFTSGKMKLMYPLMKECYEPLENELQRLAKSGHVTNAKTLFGKLTSTVIARCAFATKVDPYTDPNNPIARNLEKFFEFGILNPVLALVLPAKVQDAIAFTIPPKKSFNYLSSVCKTIVEQRKKLGIQNKHGYPDFLQLLMETSKDTQSVSDMPDSESHHALEDQVDMKKELTKTTKEFNNDEIIANALLFFVAGFETISNLLTSVSLILATHPEIQEKLYQEVKAAFGEEKTSINELSYEQLTSLKYLDAFISEILRLLPPVTRVERLCIEEHTLPNGVKVEPGDLIHLPIYLMHHKSEYFYEPEKFDPERFMPENRHKVPAGSYLPFVVGPRNCIGMRFALMEAKLAIVNLVIKYKILPGDQLISNFTYLSSTPFLTRKEGVFVQISSR